MWREFRGKNDLVAFDESGEIRTLFPADQLRLKCPIAGAGSPGHKP
jgi:hypothetical protein